MLSLASAHRHDNSSWTATQQSNKGGKRGHTAKREEMQWYDRGGANDLTSAIE
jgi:hypothetical protein